jgi:hypothetical protein
VLVAEQKIMGRERRKEKERRESKETNLLYGNSGGAVRVSVKSDGAFFKGRSFAWTTRLA